MPSGLQKVVRIFVNILAAGFPAAQHWYEDQQSGFLLEFPLFTNICLRQVSLKLWKLWIILCTDLRLLRRY